MHVTTAMQAAMQIAAVVTVLTECIISKWWLNQQPMCSIMSLRLPVGTCLCPLHTCFVQSLGHISSLTSRYLKSIWLAIPVHPAYVCLVYIFGAKSLPAIKSLFCSREGRSMLSPPALGSSRRQASANDPSGGRRSSQEGLWGRLSSQEAIGGLSRQSLFGGLSALASSRHLGSPEGNGGKSRRNSAENAGTSPGGRAPSLGAAAKRGSFFMPDLPRYLHNFFPHAPNRCCCQYLCQAYIHVPKRSNAGSRWLEIPGNVQLDTHTL